jgi:hypothetical protein
MNIVASTPSTRSSTSNTLFGAIRIDEEPIHNMSYQLTFEKGEAIFYANIVNFDGENTLIDELIRGRSVRFKLRAGDKDYYLRFPLSGYDEAQKRTRALCQEMGKGTPDKDFFTQNPSSQKLKVKNDKEYF